MSETSDSGHRDVLTCALCLHARTGRAEDAVTVIEGMAVCYDHMGYAQGGKFTAALATVLREQRARS